MFAILIAGVSCWGFAAILFVVQVANPKLPEKWNRRITALEGILSLLGGALIAIYLAQKDMRASHADAVVVQYFEALIL